MSLPSSMRPPSSRRKDQLVDERFREWEARQKAAGNQPAKPSSAPARDDKAHQGLDFDDREEQGVDGDGKGK